jgi:hypothetical protein
MADELATIANRVWRARANVVSGMVRNGKWSDEAADRVLRPWKAICVLAGCDIAALSAEDEADYNDIRRPVVHYPGNCQPGRKDYLMEEWEARSLLATTLCSPLRWGRELGEATNRAAERHTQNPTAETLANWRDLATLSRALEVTVPWRDRRTTQVQAPERMAA